MRLIAEGAGKVNQVMVSECPADTYVLLYTNTVLFSPLNSKSPKPRETGRRSQYIT